MHYFEWVPGEQNIADGFKKGLIDRSHPLWKLMAEENRLTATPNAWSCSNLQKREKNDRNVVSVESKIDD